MSDSKHVIKYAWDDGKKLRNPITWCGLTVSETTEWCFQDAQHALLAVDQESTTQPCHNCLRAIGKLVGANEQCSISLDDARVLMDMWDVCCSEGIGPDFEPLKQRFGRLYPELKEEYSYHYWET